MNTKILFVVAHPDDEMLWGGMNLLLDSGWLVIVSTHGNKKDFRSNEFKNSIITTSIIFSVFRLCS